MEGGTKKLIACDYDYVVTSSYTSVITFHLIFYIHVNKIFFCLFVLIWKFAEPDNAACRPLSWGFDRSIAGAFTIWPRRAAQSKGGSKTSLLCKGHEKVWLSFVKFDYNLHLCFQ